MGLTAHARIREAAWEAWKEKAWQHGETEEHLVEEFDKWWYETRNGLIALRGRPWQYAIRSLPELPKPSLIDRIRAVFLSER